ncbi:MAG: hypothetical protein ACJ73N_05670 [Bryobacteraceae bacterium]
MKELAKIKEQLDKGQGLTAAQGSILWDALSEASRRAHRSVSNSTPAYLSGLANAYSGLWQQQNRALAQQWQSSTSLLDSFWPKND